MPNNILTGYIGCNNQSAPHAAAVSSGTENYTMGSGALKGSTDDTSKTTGINQIFFEDKDGRRLSLGDIEEAIRKGDPEGGIASISHTSAITGKHTMIASELTQKVKTLMKKISGNFAEFDDAVVKARLGELEKVLEKTFSAPNDNSNSLIATIFRSKGGGRECKAGELVSKVVQHKKTRLH